MTTHLTSKQQKIVDYILSQIEKNNLSAGDKLDTETNIAQLFSITRTTVREATKYLINEGIIYRAKGLGLFVGSDSQRLNLTGKFKTASHLEYQAKKQGYNPKRKVLSISMVPVPDKEIAVCLKIKITDYVYVINRLLCFDDIPVSYEHTYIPVALIPTFEIGELEISKFAYIEKVVGKKIVTRMQTTTAVLPSEKIANNLQITMSTPLLKKEEITLLDGDIPCEYNTSYTNPEYLPLVFTETIGD